MGAVGEDYFDDVNTPGCNASLAAVRPGELPITAYAAQALRTTEGLHCMLDCPTVGATPDYGAVVPLTAVETSRLFGTDQPRTERVHVELSRIDASRWMDRWQGRYVVGFDAEYRPVTLHFFGFSAD